MKTLRQKLSWALFGAAILLCLGYTLVNGLRIAGLAGSGDFLAADSAGNVFKTNAPAGGGAGSATNSFQGARILKTGSSQSIPANTATLVTFNTVVYDTDSMTASANQLTMPRAGYYHLTAQLYWNAGGAGTSNFLRETFIRIGGSIGKDVGAEMNYQVDSELCAQNVSAVIYMAQSDPVTVIATHTRSAAESLLVDGTLDGCWLSAVYLGATNLSVSTSPMTQTNFVLNQIYTNANIAPILVRASTFLVGAAVNGNSAVDLMYSPTGGVGYVMVARSALNTTITGLAVSVTNDITGVITNGGNYYFTNTSSGAGNSAGLVAGTGQVIIMGGGVGGGGGGNFSTNSDGSANFTGTGVGGASFYDNAQTEYFRIEAPFNVQTNSVLRGLSNATAGVLVAQPVDVGTNQAQAVPLTPGQYVTYNGTAYVPSNLPSVSAFPLLADANGGGFSFTNLVKLSLGIVVDSGVQNPSLTLSGTNSAGALTSWRLRSTNALLTFDSPTAPVAAGSAFTISTNGAYGSPTASFTSTGAGTVASIAASGALQAGASSSIGFNGRSKLTSGSDGVMSVLNSALTQYSSLASSNIATYGTNWTGDTASFVGFTNTSAHTQIWNVRGTSGNLVFWNRVGALGGTAAGIATWTNTVTASGSDIVVGVNCGIAIDTGAGVVGGGRAF